eukprot:4336652-Prymnesium_polylepis.1
MTDFPRHRSPPRGTRPRLRDGASASELRVTELRVTECRRVVSPWEACAVNVLWIVLCRASSISRGARGRRGSWSRAAACACHAP